MIQIAKPSAPPAAPVFPLFALGFRPFFLAGAGFGVVGVALWIAALLGAAQPAFQPLGGWLTWHRHEMPFGFALAIVAGFSLTAIQNWTGQASLKGAPLAVLCGFWLSARLFWLGGAPWEYAFAADSAFLLTLACAVGRMLWRARQTHSIALPLTIALLWLADAEFFAGLARGDADLSARAALSAIWLITALMTMIGGRVIPFFTQQTFRDKAARHTPLALDAALMLSALALSFLAALGAGRAANALWTPFFLALFAGHCWRFFVWRGHTPAIWRVPLLWPLFASMLWLCLSLLGFALFHAGMAAAYFPALHALTIGAMGGLILAMIARVSLAHTGRPLIASRPMFWAFTSLNLGGIARVFLAPFFYAAGLSAAAFFWVAAFMIFVWQYAPMLCRARADGTPG
ncbi:MAG: NnrS family protein [Zoogloeaceae bacterium]|nr:NnrS family protein [Zoogloeaceae bacterium]